MTRSAERVETTLEGSVAILRFLNPPDAFIGVQGAGALRDALQGAIDDDAVRVIILTGSGPGAFIRHADVAQIARAGEALRAGLTQPADFASGPFVDLTAMLDAARKPVIAAIDGPCMGGGLEIALACTMRIAGLDATTIGLPEIRIDLVPGAGGIGRVARIAGWHRARLIALRGTIFDASAALEFGLVDEVAPSAFPRAIEIASELAMRSVHGVAAILRLSHEQGGHAAAAVAFAELLRDSPTVTARLNEFAQGVERLDELP